MSDSAKARGKQLNVTVGDELHAEVTRRAIDLERSVAGHVRRLLREDLAAAQQDRSTTTQAN